MSAPLLTIAALGAVAVLCAVLAGIMSRRHTRELDRLGAIYRCARWPREDNRSYLTRLRGRIRDSWSA